MRLFPQLIVGLVGLAHLATGATLAVTTTSLPNWTVGQPYSQSVMASGGTGSGYTWSISAGTPPAGLSLSAAGTFSGTPTMAGTSSFTVQVTDSAHDTATKGLSITVNPLPAVTTTSLPNATVGQPYGPSLTASGGTSPYTWSISTGTLPAGLSLISSGAFAGTFSGTPTAAGVSSFTVQVTDSAHASATASLSITVIAPTPVLSSLIPSSIAAGSAGFTLQVFGSNFANNASVIWNGASLVSFVANSGLLEATIPASLIASPGTATVTATGASNSLTFTITGSILAVSTTSLPNGTVGQTYSASLTATGGTSSYTWSVVSGALPAGLGLSQAGSISGTPTASGTSSFTVQVSSGGLTATAALSITVSAPAFAITTASLPGGMVGQAYSQTVAASGGTPPYTWSIPSPPQGFPLTINASSGVLSGTPTASGTFTFTIQATDSASPQNMATQNYTVTFTVAPLTINTLSPLPNGAVGNAYSVTLTASGGTSPYTWSITSGSVAGLSLGASTGVLQGTPTASGAFSLTIRVTDSASHQASQNFSLTVNPATVTIISISPPPNGVVGVAYNPSQQPQFSAAGGTPPYTWSISAGNPPPGLTIGATSGCTSSSSNCSAFLSGTPNSGGTFTFTVQAADSSTPPITGTRAFTITIGTGLTITTASQLPDTTLGSAFSYTMTAAGGAPPYTWSANGLPSGLSINASTGVISGTTASAGTISFAVTVVDSAQASASARFNINVIPQPLPVITITGLPNTANPLQQYSISLTLASAYPSADISGTLILTSAPADNGPNDTSIQFSSGGQSASFTIPAGSTTPTGTLKIQVGTVAGTITVAIAHVLVGGFDVTPSPAPAESTQLAAAAPVITSATASVSGSTLTIQIAGYAASREVTQATFNFSAATGQSLASSQFNIPVDSIFSPYYQNAANAAFGSQFVFTQPFTIQGSASGVIPQSVTLTNRVGSTTASVTQ